MTEEKLIKKPYTIQIMNKKIKDAFEKDRFMLRQKEGRLITQEEFIVILIKFWRMKGKEK